MKQLKPMQSEETKFMKVYRRHQMRKNVVSPRETKRFVKTLHESVGYNTFLCPYEYEKRKFDLQGQNDYGSRNYVKYISMFIPGRDGLFVATDGASLARVAFLIDADGTILSCVVGEKKLDCLDRQKRLLNKLAVDVAKNPELIKRLPCEILDEMAINKIDFKQEVLTAYTERFEAYIYKADVNADTDLTEATQSAQTELGMLKETLIKMEKELQEKRQKEKEDKKTVENRKLDAICNLKRSLKRDDTEAE